MQNFPGDFLNTLQLFGETFTVDYCTEKDVSDHYEVIRRWVQDSDETKFKAKMKACVTAGTAFKVNNSSCFMYYLNREVSIADGVAFYGRGATKAIIAMILIGFGTIDTNTFAIDFQLHDGKTINEYRSILTKSSLHTHITQGSPVMVRIDKLLKKYRALVSAQKNKGNNNG